jgi:hypothetical protein
MEHLSSPMEQHQHQEQLQVQWRRDKVQELCGKGYTQREISQVLQVGLATANRNISYLRNQLELTSAARRVREMYGWAKCNHKRSMQYSLKYRRQKRKDNKDHIEGGDLEQS